MPTREWKPRRIRSEDERGTGSSEYISLDEGQNFLGYALFEADPKLEDPGYYEYAEHYVPSLGPRGGSVPCAGDDCPLCEDGDRPRTRAKTLWLVTEDQKNNELDPPELRIFNLNYSMIKAFTAIRAEDEKIKGRLWRITRTDDRGGYQLLPKTATLKAAEIKEALKDPKAPDFDAMVTGQLRKVMESMAIRKAVEDDDEPDEPTTKSNGKGKATEKASVKSKAKDWPDDGLDELEVTVVEVEDDGNYFTAKADGYKGTVNIYTTKGIEFDLTDLSENDVVTVSTGALDDEGDYVLSAEPEVAESEEEPEEESTEDVDAPDDDLPDNVEDLEMKVTSVNAGESTLDVEGDDLKFTLYFLDQGPASEVDFADYEEGMVVTVSAEKDSSADMVATEVPQAVKKASGRKTSTGRKTATAKGK